jgi:exodeoxyribonuclease-5
MTWSPQQDAALKAVATWIRNKRGPQVFRLFGYAGSGKTTLARALAAEVKGDVIYGAFTGKAALVLRRKGCADASTIHSLIYRVDEDSSGWQPVFRLDRNSAVKDAGLVIIDECSMVGEDVGHDLLSFGTKVLVLGDPAQLPPVKGEGFFTNAAPDVMLTEVHRQARDNPIIAMSMAVRESRRPLPAGAYGTSRVIPRERVSPEMILKTGQVLVGRNRTRRAYNARIRHLLGRDPAGPVPGDKLICLRNNREKKLLNGGLWTVEGIKRRAPDAIEMDATSEDTVETAPTRINVLREFFSGDEAEIPWERRRGSDEFTYGYAITCHKSQGSQWDDVVVFDESSVFREDAWRWTYTAVTRAAERVTIVHP